MKSDINIADILKNKPQGTKLYTDTFGELTIVNICPIAKIGITLAGIKGKELWFYNDGRYSMHGEPILFPSNIMRMLSLKSLKMIHIQLSKVDIILMVTTRDIVIFLDLTLSVPINSILKKVMLFRSIYLMSKKKLVAN